MLCVSVAFPAQRWAFGSDGSLLEAARTERPCELKFVLEEAIIPKLERPLAVVGEDAVVGGKVMTQEKAHWRRAVMCRGALLEPRAGS